VFGFYRYFVIFCIAAAAIWWTKVHLSTSKMSTVAVVNLLRRCYSEGKLKDVAEIYFGSDFLHFLPSFLSFYFLLLPSLHILSFRRTVRSNWRARESVVSSAAGPSKSIFGWFIAQRTRLVAANIILFMMNKIRKLKLYVIISTFYFGGVLTPQTPPATTLTELL